MIELSKNISEYIGTTFGKEYLENYKQFYSSKYPLYIRLSALKIEEDQILNNLELQGVKVKKSVFLPNAYQILEGEQIVGKTLEHSIGKYYVQSLSSMIPPIVLNPTEKDIVMDLCSAPGSKSTQISELMNYKGTLYSNEPNLSRVKALVHNLDKMNSVNMGVIKYNGELLSKYFNNFFDKILVDAPCSALGIVQKKQEVSNWWDTKQAERISDLQLKLLISAIKMLKVGGDIVYSTCTLTVEENEFIINKVLKKYPVELQKIDLSVPYVDGFTKIKNFTFDKTLNLTKRILPWELKSEGFFIAKLKKVSEMEVAKSERLPKSKKYFISSTDTKIKDLLIQLSKYFEIPIEVFALYKYLINGNDINFVNIDYYDFNSDFFIRTGTKFGSIDKNNIIKLHTHAAQILGEFAAKNIITLKNEDELKLYFAGGIIYHYDLSKGQKIVKFNNYFLGTAVAFDNQLKSQFPRSKRTGNINIL